MVPPPRLGDAVIDGLGAAIWVRLEEGDQAPPPSGRGREPGQREGLQSKRQVGDTSHSENKGGPFIQNLGRVKVKV